jgi:hypothetical protein
MYEPAARPSNWVLKIRERRENPPPPISKAMNRNETPRTSLSRYISMNWGLGSIYEIQLAMGL